MNAPHSFAQGTIYFFSDSRALALIFTRRGIPTKIGEWALRLFEPPRFEIGYVGNVSPDAPYQIEVDGHGIPIETMAGWCDNVATCLRDNGIRFDLTHFAAEGEEIRVYEA